MYQDTLNALFSSYGYKRFRMSKFEEYDLYAQNKDFLKSRQLITFNDMDGKLLALKPDVTISIIRNNNGENEKVYYNEMVYRPSNHHYREIPQTGIECIGTIDALEEAEVIAMAAKALGALSGRWVLRICDAGLLRAVLEELNVDAQIREEVLSAVSRKASDEIAGLVKNEKLTKQAGDVLVSLISIYAPLAKGIEEAGKLLNSVACLQILAHLHRLAEILPQDSENIRLDFSVVSNMDYYNGVIFQGAVEEIPFPLLSGGRYDPLPQKMGRKVCAIGFAVYMDYVQNYSHHEQTYDADLVVRYEEADDYAALARAAEILRSRGLSVRLMRSEDTARIRSRRTISFRQACEEAGL